MSRRMQYHFSKAHSRKQKWICSVILWQQRCCCLSINKRQNVPELLLPIFQGCVIKTVRFDKYILLVLTVFTMNLTLRVNGNCDNTIYVAKTRQYRLLFKFNKHKYWLIYQALLQMILNQDQTKDKDSKVLFRDSLLEICRQKPHCV